MSFFPAELSDQQRKDVGTIATAMNLVMENAKRVAKDKENTFHRYKYAGEDDLLEVIRPELVAQGLLIVPSVYSQPTMDDNGTTTVNMHYTLVHKSGALWPWPIFFWGTGNDKNKGGIGDKGLYKAYTGANKYMLFKLFQIATGDDPEDEARSASQPASRPGAVQPQTRNSTAPRSQSVAQREAVSIPVSLDRNGDPDWRLWATAFIAEIKKAATTDELGALFAVNEANAMLLEAALPMLYGDVYRMSEERMAGLSADPVTGEIP